MSKFNHANALEVYGLQITPTSATGQINKQNMHMKIQIKTRNDVAPNKIRLHLFWTSKDGFFGTTTDEAMAPFNK